MWLTRYNRVTMVTWSSRLMSLLVVSLLLACSPSVVAEMVGSPAGILKKGKWVMGLSGGGTTGRQMSGDGQTTLYHGSHYRGYGPTDRVSLYLKLGAASIKIDDPGIIKANNPSTTNNFGGNFMTGVQLKGKLFESPRWRWEWDGSLQYLDIHTRHKNKNELRWHEWQIATSVAKELGRVKPYIGVKYSLTDVLYRVRQNGKLLKQGHYHEQTRVGLFLGTDYYFGDSEDVILNLESAYQDGPEFLVSLAYTF